LDTEKRPERSRASRGFNFGELPTPELFQGEVERFAPETALEPIGEDFNRLLERPSRRRDLPPPATPETFREDVERFGGSPLPSFQRELQEGLIEVARGISKVFEPLDQFGMRLLSLAESRHGTPEQKAEHQAFVDSIQDLSLKEQFVRVSEETERKFGEGGTVAERYNALPIWKQMLLQSPIFIGAAVTGITATGARAGLQTAAQTGKLPVRIAAQVGRAALAPIAAQEWVVGQTLNAVFGVPARAIGRRLTTAKLNAEFSNTSWAKSPFGKEWAGTELEQDMKSVFRLYRTVEDENVAKQALNRIIDNFKKGRYGVPKAEPPPPAPQPTAPVLARGARPPTEAPITPEPPTTPPVTPQVEVPPTPPAVTPPAEVVPIEIKYTNMKPETITRAQSLLVNLPDNLKNKIDIA
ncbi:hypothetical protein LCGC14_2793520, partial [marine sediment metagenome]